jgi:hypothetical protein
MKKELYQAVGFTTLLVAMSFPLALLGMKLLNLFFSMIPE